MAYEINWSASTGNQRLMLSPLYIKYASSAFQDIDIGDVRTDLNGVMATAESAEICAYLSWLIRTLELIDPLA